MDTKVCFKCGKEKSISDFYKHPEMSDGHLNKCKECAKKDVRDHYSECVLNDSYVEKERERGRIKYAKYKYNKNNNERGCRDCASYLKKRGFDMRNKEVHHWNYNKNHDVFILGRRAHSLVHKYIVFDESTKLFRLKSDMSLIDTKEKHYNLIKDIFLTNNVNYEIESYPTEIDL